MSNSVEQMPQSIDQGQFMQTAANVLRRNAPLAVSLAAGLAIAGCSSEAKPAADGGHASSSPSNEVCLSSNVMPNDVHGSDIHRPFKNGLQTEQGKPVASLAEWKQVVIRGIKRDGTTLRYEAQSYNLPTPPLSDLAHPLGQGKGCITPAGRKLQDQVEGIVLASSHSKVAEASSSARNSGVDTSGNLVAAAHTGISGNRIAISTTLPDGTVHTQLLRCGNLVNPVPGTPVGPTDQTPRPPRSPRPPQPSHSPTPPNVPPKHDDGRLPQVPGAAPAEQDPGTPGKPGTGPAGQPVSPNGTVPGETPPTQAPYSPEPQPQPQPTSPNTQPTTTPETGAPQPVTTPVPVVTASPQATATMPPQPN